MIHHSIDDSTECLGTEEFSEDHFSSDEDFGEGHSAARMLANHIAKYMTPKNKLMAQAGVTKHFNFSSGDIEGEL